MTKARFIGVMVVALAVVATAGGLVASNMGFKLNYSLLATGDTVPGDENVDDGLSKDGTNTIALPYFRESTVNSAKDLLTKIGSSATNLQKFVRDNNALCTYTGSKGSPCTSNFSLTAGAGYRIKMSSSNGYIVVGAHDPAATVTLLATGDTVPGDENVEDGLSKDGTNVFGYPYHSTSSTAKAMLTEIGSAATNMQKFIRDNNALCTYTGSKGSPCTSNFSLKPGESYRIKVSASTSFIPNHY